MAVTAHSAAAYQAQLGALLPTGRAWPREGDSTLMQMLGAWADGLARVDGRAADLIEESDPRTTLEMLADWERLLGLPDSCFGAPDNIAERRVAIAQRLSAVGGQSRAYFTALASSLGYAVVIDELAAARCGSRIGARIGGPDWAFTWRVRVLPINENLDESQRYFAQARCGSRCGVRIRGWGAIDLECLIRRHAPAHTTVLFAYDVDPEPLVWFDFTTD